MIVTRKKLAVTVPFLANGRSWMPTSRFHLPHSQMEYESGRLQIRTEVRIRAPLSVVWHVVASSVPHVWNPIERRTDLEAGSRSVSPLQVDTTAASSVSTKRNVTASREPKARVTFCPYDAEVLQRDPRAEFSMSVGYRTGRTLFRAKTVYTMWEADELENEVSDTSAPTTKTSVLEVVETYQGLKMDWELRKAIEGTDKQYDAYWLHYFRYCVEGVAEAIQALSESMVRPG